MQHWKRLALVLLLAVLTGAPVRAGATDNATAAAAGSCGPDCSAVFFPPLLRACLLAIPLSAINTANRTQAVFPGDPGYDWARKTFNARILRSPAAIFYAYNAEGVAAAVACGAAQPVPVSPAAGRQSFEGTAVVDGGLIVDVSNITFFEVAPDNQTLTVGAGLNGAMLAAALHDAGLPGGAAVPSGVCSFVGIAGWLLGGGAGWLGRHLGMGCESLMGVEYVLANGSVVWANATSHPGLFWASCGGGGGTFGIATRFQLRISQLPNGGRVTRLSMSYTPNATAEAWLRFQDALPGMSSSYGWAYSVLAGSLRLTGIYLGPQDEALAGLDSMGLLQDLNSGQDLNATITGLERGGLDLLVPKGLEASSHPSYYDYVMRSAPFWASSRFGLAPPWGSFAYKATPENEAYLAALMRGQGGLHVTGGPSYSSFYFSQSRLSGALPPEGVQAAAKFVADTWQACQDSGLAAPECRFVWNGHVLGGAYSATPPNATAFPWRDALFILDGTLDLPSADYAPSVAGTNLSDPDVAAGMAAAQHAAQVTDSWLSTIKPYIGSPERGYTNYQLPQFADWQEGFFGANYPRLQAVKAQYDPLGLFNKPFTVVGAAGATAAGASG
ncbi:hypothetical protein ABPG75_006392 [Micractinium tetrahymenae]